MTIMMALQGLLPLIVFAIVDIFASLRAALIAALIFAVLELGWGYYSFGEVDTLSWVSLGLVLVMGGLSIYMKSDKLFKFQPVALALVTGGTFLYFQLTGNPLMVQMIPKVVGLLPEDQRARMASPQVIESIKRLDMLMIVVFLVHGVFVAWAALRRSTVYWLVARGVGFYALLFAALAVNAVMTMAASG